MGTVCILLTGRMEIIASAWITAWMECSTTDTLLTLLLILAGCLSAIVIGGGILMLLKGTRLKRDGDVTNTRKQEERRERRVPDPQTEEPVYESAKEEDGTDYESIRSYKP